MFFIFGWGKTTTKPLGQADDHAACGICSQSVPFHFIKVTHWFTLFFIPVIPYKSQAYMICPHCQNGFEIPMSQISAANGDLNQVARSHYSA
ncbi:zinc-ribbon domain-containing protein [Thaumasiovibrio subtropicus]|uniref:zinc-ribbon domain-containing protein n=1 Tax=Thaumasiovibrio subtropicus TaxID=1891207 RepID=UPI000B35E319|nr:zinc ribbon domain-containing protein [Thaumasiovibrio subtropicus]